jgi:aspartyl-tRNA(Asn)/glutamyl-tRNA(Gln) amidotransferase subunit B
MKPTGSAKCLPPAEITQETRGWDDESGQTVSQRSKEFAHDYRYFPEPDLPPLVVSSDWVPEIRSRLPELPDQRCERFVQAYDLSVYDAGLLTANKETADYFEGIVKTTGRPAKEVANWVAGPVLSIVNAKNIDIDVFGMKVPADRLARLVDLVGQGSINMATAKAVLEEMYDSGKDADCLIEEKGLAQINGTDELDQFAQKVIQTNQPAVEDYRAGKDQALKFLVGQMMRLTRGRANPGIAADIIKRKLEEGS